MAQIGSRPEAPTPVGAVVRGLVAGAFGTAAMDALLYKRYRRGGGSEGLKEWELSSDLSSWEQAPAPAQSASASWRACSASSWHPRAPDWLTT